MDAAERVEAVEVALRLRIRAHVHHARWWRDTLGTDEGYGREALAVHKMALRALWVIRRALRGEA